MLLRISLLSLVLLAGCESGVTRSVEVTIPAEIVDDYSAAAPGLVVANMGSFVAHYVALCGQDLQMPLLLVQDNEFSCLRESGGDEGSEQAVQVWVQPLPAGWTAEEVCASTEQVREYYQPRGFLQVDGGPERAALPSEPESGWPQGSGSGVWQRDFTPCGGGMSAQVTLSR